MIYLDYNASTPMLPEVELAVIESWKYFSNPSGSHRGSLIADTILDDSRNEIASILGVPSSSVIFTSGATEALAIAMWGQVLGSPISRKKILIGAMEHKAVLETAERVAKVAGKEVILIPGQRDGQINLDFLGSQLSDDVALLAIMAVNNETGVIFPYSEISEMACIFGIPYLCDTTQAIGKWENFHASELKGMFTISGHKIYGPKGVGALIMDRDLQAKAVAINPGGGQERGLRGGTSNISGTVGLATAMRLMAKDLDGEMSRQEKLRNRLWDELSLYFGQEILLNSALDPGGIKNTLNVRFNSIAADAVLVNLKSVMASRASACTTGMEEPSHVLLAMGLSAKEAEESMRFSLGRGTTEADITATIADVSEAVDRVRALGR